MSYPEAMSEIANYPKALSHAGSGGGANLKTLNLVNNTARNIRFSYCVIDGYYNDIIVNAGETAAVQYVTPSTEVIDYPIDYIIGIMGSLENVTVDTPAGVEYVTDYPPAGLYISNAAADGATVTFTGGAV